MLGDEKSDLRKSYCVRREGLDDATVIARSAAVCRRLARMRVLVEADTVMAYLAFRQELDLTPLFELLPEVEWVLPRLEGRRMVLHPYDSEDLVRHPYGMLEPSANAPVVNPQDVDVVLVPGVAFDRRGGRLGFGGGFYDRFLEDLSAVRVGISYDVCLAEGLPCADHDQRMDWVVTPTETIHTAPR